MKQKEDYSGLEDITYIETSKSENKWLDILKRSIRPLIIPAAIVTMTIGLIRSYAIEERKTLQWVEDRIYLSGDPNYVPVIQGKDKERLDLELERYKEKNGLNSKI